MNEEKASLTKFRLFEIQLLRAYYSFGLAMRVGSTEGGQIGGRRAMEEKAEKLCWGNPPPMKLFGNSSGRWGVDPKGNPADQPVYKGLPGLDGVMLCSSRHGFGI